MNAIKSALGGVCYFRQDKMGRPVCGAEISAEIFMTVRNPGVNTVHSTWRSRRQHTPAVGPGSVCAGSGEASVAEAVKEGE